MAGFYKYGNEHLGFKYCREFLEWLRNSELIKDSAQWSYLVYFIVCCVADGCSYLKDSTEH
jgi:hypothetical protein